MRYVVTHKMGGKKIRQVFAFPSLTALYHALGPYEVMFVVAEKEVKASKIPSLKCRK